MKFEHILGFAEEKSELTFHGMQSKYSIENNIQHAIENDINKEIWDWFITYNDVYSLWQAQPSFICVQLLVLIGNLATLYHAIKTKGYFLYLWIGIILHGLVIELVSYNLPDIDNFWHSQTPLMFLGRRLPLHIILIYVIFIYPATVAVSKLKLPKWSEALAIGLITVLIDYPYDIVGIRFMHWTWHDTDPNISEKHYHVPWNSFYFHAAFTASFIFFFQSTRFILCGRIQKQDSNKFNIKELLCTVIAATLGMPGGVIIFILLYHPLHDIYKINSETTFFILLTIYLSLIILSFPRISNQNKDDTNQKWNFIIFLYMLLYYTSFIGIVILFDPAAEVSIGLHEPIGPCDEKIKMQTALGHTLYKRKYLCVTDNDETYFGWSCLPNKKAPRYGANWYTICGTTFKDKMEYCIILTIAAIFGCIFFYKTLFSKRFCNCENKISLQGNKKKVH